MAKINISTFAADSVESINNGNMSHVIEQIDQLPKKHAMAAVAYIVKPFHIKELLARIKVHLHEDELPKGDVPSPLTEREREVVKLLASGKTYKQVAHALQVSQSTIRNHLHNVYHKLEVVDRAQAVIVSREQGWI